MSQFHQSFITVLIDLYGLELDGHQVDLLIVTWLQKYDNAWIVKAIVESLYRGRYKIKSVDNILKDWQRLGQPRYNFTPEYEREILQNLPDLTDLPANYRSATLSAPVVNGEESGSADTSGQEHRLDPKFIVIKPTGQSSKHLNPEESAPFQRHHHAIPADRLVSAQVGTVLVSAAPTHINSDPIDSSQLEDHHAFTALTRSSFAMLYRRGYVSSDGHIKFKADRMISQPVKLQLFKTLKAIVDPRNQQEAVVHNLVCPQLHIEETNFSHITQFKVSHQNISEEQYL